MKAKFKKYNVGGMIQAGLGLGQTIYGATQLPKAKAEFQRAQAAAPSLETPSQYYENFKNAYDSELARMQDDMINRNLATSVQALQGAGGRALVGGLGATTAQAQMSQNQMLAQERAARMQAGSQLAAAEERAIGRKEARSQQEIQMANQAYQAALGNIGGGLGSMGTGLMYGLEDFNLRDLVNGRTQKTVSNTVTPEMKKVAGMSIPMTDKLSPVESPDFSSYLKGAKESGRNAIDRLAVENDITDRKNLEASLKLTNETLEKANQPKQKTQGVIESVSETMADNLYSKMEDSIERSVSKSEFDESMVGDGQFYQSFGDTVLIRNMSPQQLREKRFFDNVNKVGTRALTGYGMQSVIGNLKQHGGMMTDGEFNHATNPIDIVQNGIKVGEATGNEYILNPKQAAAIANESSYAKKLFKRFEKNAKKKK